jgi:hypothetical protein
VTNYWTNDFEHDYTEEEERAYIALIIQSAERRGMNENPRVSG